MMMVPSKEYYYDIYRCLRDEVLNGGRGTKSRNNVKLTKVKNGVCKDYQSIEENSYFDLDDDRNTSDFNTLEENGDEGEYGNGCGVEYGNGYGGDYGIAYGGEYRNGYGVENGNEYGGDYKKDYGGQYGNEYGGDYRKDYGGEYGNEYGDNYIELDSKQESERKESGYQSNQDTDQFYPIIL